MNKVNAALDVEAVAIIGMAGRFPKAANLEEFWERLQAGEELVTFFTDEELLAAGIAPSLVQNEHYVKARAVLEDAELFDAAFFGYNPREAETMDPQQRLFLECAWEALENAGYDPDRYEGSAAVYAGLSMNSYLFNNLLANPETLDSVDSYQLMLSNDKDFLTTRVSYKLNLKGPSINVQTACSTSLVAVHLACQSLLDYQCDLSLAGGVSVGAPRKGGHLYQPGMILSPDGHCRAFDAQSQGIVPGEGVGLVVLKRLSDALADGDTIHAIIRGSAINNDGAQKVGYTAPSVGGQAEVIAVAHALAGVEPETITYVEAHGTGTELGDPVEITALTQAFRAGTQARQFCAVGSVKSNMGHLDAAAGIAGLLKTILALKHGQIPPSLHFQAPNPRIDFANSPFYVNTELSPWQTNGHPRRAGVSSFGIGGTNAHVVLEEAPIRRSIPSTRPSHLLVLSARTTTALDRATDRLVQHLQAHPELDLADLAYTLQVGRKFFGQRRIAVCRDRAEAISALENMNSRRVATDLREFRGDAVAFLFPGQGAQYVQMARELYQAEPLFRSQVDYCAEILKNDLGLDLREVLYPEPDQEEGAALQLLQTHLTQPVLFVIEYALAKLWMAWGIHPKAMIGHSIGEYVAACLAGVFSLEDALALVAFRGRLMQELPGGSMLAVFLSEAEVRLYLTAELALAAINGPQLCVVSGPDSEIEALQRRLETDDVAYRSLHTSHAFHSQMMDPILERFGNRVAQVQLHMPALPFISNLTGTWITAEQAIDPGYWTAHLRSTVLFSRGMAELLQDPDLILLEVGPGRTLSSLAKQQDHHSIGRVVVASLPHPHDPSPDYTFLMNTLGRLWLAGVDIEWSHFYEGERRHRIPLPTYPFERQRYWIDPQTPSHATATIAPRDRSIHTSSQSLVKRSDMAKWFYAPSWKRADLPRTARQSNGVTPPQHWLIFQDTCGMGARLTHRLMDLGHHVVNVLAGDEFSCVGPGVYSLPPATKESYEALFLELRNRGQTPDRIVHLWNISASDAQENLAVDTITATEDLAFYSLLYLAQALEGQGTNDQVQIDIVANGLHEVSGEEPLFPAKALLLGPCQVIPQENPQFTCRSIDIVLPENWADDRVLDQVWDELQAQADEKVVAYRGRHRWIQSFEPLRHMIGTTQPPLLHPEGVYLITGGLGGIGLTLAEYLAETVQARLVLTSRTVLPERSRWESWIADHGDINPISRKIRKVQALEGMGAEVLVIAADVANLAQMQIALDEARSRFGAINGVIHAAGIAGGGIIPLKTRVMAEQVLAPKVLGTAVLNAVLVDEQLDFFVMCSSFNSVFGGIGQVDYVAANAVLDAFAHAQDRQNGPRTIAINWATWQDVGMAVETKVPVGHQHVKEEMLRKGLTSNEGREVFHRILANPLPQIVVSPQDLQDLMQLAGEGSLSGRSEGESSPASDEDPVSHMLHPRPEIQTAYAAPGTETERTVVSLWQSLLGIAEIGIHDNFFELGGHSLLATQLVARLQEQFNVDLSLRTIFEMPTVAHLATLITQQTAEQIEDDKLMDLLAEIENLSQEDVQHELGVDSRIQETP